MKNPYLKVLVMEGFYDLATPFYAADYTIDHLNLPPQYRKNISFATTTQDTWSICRRRPEENEGRRSDSWINPSSTG